MLKITFVFLEDFGSLSVVSSSRFAVLSDGGLPDPPGRESNFARPGASGGKKQPEENERAGEGRGGATERGDTSEQTSGREGSPFVRLGPLHDVGKNLGFGPSHHVHHLQDDYEYCDSRGAQQQEGKRGHCGEVRCLRGRPLSIPFASRGLFTGCQALQKYSQGFPTEVTEVDCEVACEGQGDADGAQGQNRAFDRRGERRVL